MKKKRVKRGGEGGAPKFSGVRVVYRVTEVENGFSRPLESNGGSPHLGETTGIREAISIWMGGSKEGPSGGWVV